MKYLLFLIFLVPFLKIEAQNRNNIIEYDEEKGLIIEHIMLPGQTIYGITTHYGYKLDHTIELNPMRDLNLMQPGDKSYFGIRPELIEKTALTPRHSPLTYIVKSKETLYAIARTYVDKDVRQIMELNNMSSYQIHPGDTLLMGYIERPFYLENDKILSPLSQVAITTNDNIDTTVIIPQTAMPSKINIERGLAYWHVIDNSYSDYVVMHKEAPINSEIKIYNPMMDRSIDAVVVGSIPEKSYPDNIRVVISPAVANALGALDKRFIVEMTY